VLVSVHGSATYAWGWPAWGKGCIALVGCHLRNTEQTGLQWHPLGDWTTTGKIVQWCGDHLAGMLPAASCKLA